MTYIDVDAGVPEPHGHPDADWGGRAGSWPDVERRRSPRRRGERAEAGNRRRVPSPPRPVNVPTASSRRREWTRLYLRLVVVVDIVAGIIGAALAFSIRFGAGPHASDSPYLYGLLAVPLSWVAAVAVSRAYEERFFVSGSEELGRVSQAAVGLIAAVSTVSYALQAELARGYVVIALPTAYGLALVGRLVAHRVIRKQRTFGRYVSDVVVVGHEWSVLDLAREIRKDRGAGLRVVGACLPAGSGSRQMAHQNVPVLGDLDQVAEVVRRSGADAVAVTTCVEFDGTALRRLCWALEDTSVDVIVAPALVEVAGPRLHIRPVSGLPLLHVEKPEFSGVRRACKALLDKTLALTALIMLSPVLLAVAVAVGVTSRGPVIFKQTRVGVQGRPFTVLKFRTMYVDAEQRRAELDELNERSDGVLFKIEHDPRITQVGRTLRRFSLDELPQLFNVVHGDMSLVGPRPPLPAEVERYELDVRRRLLVKPGLTGLWQVSGRSNLNWEETVRLDLRYVENWSLAFDLTILWRTVAAVVSGRGAY